MSNILEEQTLSIADAALHFPGRKPGASLCFATVWRWIAKGIKTADGRKIRLEACRLGGRWITSREAVQRFVDAMTPALADDAQAIAPRSPSARSRASERATKELERAGI